jgi:hypothetical protein
MVKRSGLLIVLLAGSVMLAACQPTPPAVTATMDQIVQAVKAKDKNALKACYARVSAKDDEAIDQALGSWDAYLDPAYTYTGVSYETADEIAKDPQRKMFLTAYQVTKVPNTNIVMAPNLPLIGFIDVKFTIAPDNSPCAASEPIGIMPDGTAKIIIVKQVQDAPVRYTPGQ